METIKLKTAVFALLTSAHSRVYEYTRVPKSAVFPYVTYNLQTTSNSFRDAVSDFDYTLEVEVFDYREDKNTDTIEALADTVFNTINRADVITDDIFIRIEPTGLLSQLPTPNEYTFRRQITSTLHYMERS